MEYPKINSLWKREGWYFDEGKKKSPDYQKGRQSFIVGVTPDMVGAIVDLRKLEGLWVIDKIHDVDIEKHQIKRSWHVGGL